MIRLETPSDLPLVRAVHTAAFDSPAEADLIDALRASGHLLVSLVAVEAGQMVGHIAFSPVSIEGVTPTGAGLAPVAVVPAFQRRGFGGQLIHAGLDACRQLKIDYVVVLGDPAYYQRFGFRPASASQLESEYDAGDAFQVLELTPRCLSDIAGVVQYGAEFRELS